MMSCTRCMGCSRCGSRRLRAQTVGYSLGLLIVMTSFAFSPTVQAQVTTASGSSVSATTNDSASAIGRTLAAQTHPAPSGNAIVSEVGSGVPALGVGGILQALFGLVVVIGLVFACGWVARRMGLKVPNGRRGGVVNVVGSASLGTRERVVVVEVAGNWLVLGVAPGSVQHLHTTPVPADHVASGAPTDDNPSFQSALAQQLRATFTKPGKD